MVSKKKKCPFCNEDIDAEVFQCPFCAEKLAVEVASVKKCPFCAEEIPVSANHCPYCNEAVAAASSGEDTKRCPICEKQVNVSATSCPYCNIKFPLLKITPAFVFGCWGFYGVFTFLAVSKLNAWFDLAGNWLSYKEKMRMFIELLTDQRASEVSRRFLNFFGADMPSPTAILIFFALSVITIFFISGVHLGFTNGLKKCILWGSLFHIILLILYPQAFLFLAWLIFENIFCCVLFGLNKQKLQNQHSRTKI